MSIPPNHPRRSRGRDVLGLLVCLLLVALINASARSEDVGQRWYTGTGGGPVSSPNVDFVVTQVQLARQVQGKYDIFETEGILVVVHWSATVKKERTYLADIELHTDDGLELSQRREFETASTPPLTMPGFTSYGVSVFETRLDSAVGADLVVPGDRGMIYVYGYAIRLVDIVPADLPIETLITLPPYYIEVTR